jgi:integrase
MASYRKRGPRQWQAQVRKKGYPLQSKTFRSKPAAEAWVRSVECEMDQGLFVSRNEAETTTLGELLERYRREYTAQKRGHASESCRIDTLTRHPLALRFVGSIRGVDIARYRDERLTKISPGSLRRELTILSQVFEVSRKEWGIFVHNPVREVKLPRNNRPRDRRLKASRNPAKDEETRLIAACRRCRNPFLLPIVKLALETAMRQGELISLRWEFIDLRRRTAYLADTKNGEPRSVPLSSAANDVLSELPRSVTGEVFPGLTGMAIKKAFGRAVLRANLDNLHFHDLRHEATTRLFERGLNIMEVASITGHKDLGMLNRYTHLRAEDLAKKLA